MWGWVPTLQICLGWVPTAHPYPVLGPLADQRSAVWDVASVGIFAPHAAPTFPPRSHQYIPGRMIRRGNHVPPVLRPPGCPPGYPTTSTHISPLCCTSWPLANLPGNLYYNSRLPGNAYWHCARDLRPRARATCKSFGVHCSHCTLQSSSLGGVSAFGWPITTLSVGQSYE